MYTGSVVSGSWSTLYYLFDVMNRIYILIITCLTNDTTEDVVGALVALHSVYVRYNLPESNKINDRKELKHMNLRLRVTVEKLWEMSKLSK